MFAITATTAASSVSGLVSTLARVVPIGGLVVWVPISHPQAQCCAVVWSAKTPHSSPPHQPVHPIQFQHPPSPDWKTKRFVGSTA
jgi:hypothetical protein